jgi:lipopolysaccharide export system protein LptC
MSELAERERTSRQIWARPDGRHDGVVRWMRRILPVGIGALVAVLIYSPLAKATGDISFVLAKDSVDMAKERMRVIAATYRGQDSEGRPFVLTAGSAIQATSREPIVRIKDVAARIEMAEGPASVVANTALYNMESEIISVTGPVTFQTADGYRLDMNNVAIALKTRQVTGNGAFAGQLPQGNVSGGTMQANLGTRQVAIGGGVSGNTPIGSFAGGQMAADLIQRRVSVTGGVSGRTRFGTYSANSLIVDQKARTLSLRGRARLIVYPGGLR